MCWKEGNQAIGDSAADPSSGLELSVPGVAGRRYRGIEKNRRATKATDGRRTIVTVAVGGARAPKPMLIHAARPCALRPTTKVLAKRQTMSRSDPLIRPSGDIMFVTRRSASPSS